MKKSIVILTGSFLISSCAFALEVPNNHIVDVAWLKSHLGDKNLVVVDVRKNTKKHPNYTNGHIKGAVHWGSRDFREGRYCNPKTQKPIPGYIAAPKTFEATMQKSGINQDTAIVFYSGGNKAKDFRDGSLAAFTAIYYGHDNVAILDGGFAGWSKNGGEVSKDVPTPAKGNFKIKKFNQDILAVAEDVDEGVTLGNYQFLDANGEGKPGKSHYHADMKKEDKRRMKEGHIPGAKALKTTEYVVKKDGVFYLDTKENLEAKLKKVGIDTTKPLITYCNTGHLAAGNWFAQQFVIGMKNNKLYSGSMADYTALPNRPLDK